MVIAVGSDVAHERAAASDAVRFVEVTSNSKAVRGGREFSA